MFSRSQPYGDGRACAEFERSFGYHNGGHSYVPSVLVVPSCTSRLAAGLAEVVFSSEHTSKIRTVIAKGMDA